jgi:hypothetical protein
MYRVKYLVYTDLDEFIIPRKSVTWAGMIKKIENTKYGAYLFRHTYFFESYDNSAFDTGASETGVTHNNSCRVDLPKLVTRVVRSWKIYPPRRKSKYIIKPLYPSIVGVHEVFKYVEDYIGTYVVPPDYALLHHYRMFDPEVIPIEEYVKRIPDEHAYVYKEKIVTALRKRLCHWKFASSLEDRP